MEVKSEYNNTILGEIPVEWKISTLENVTREINDGVHNTPSYKEKGIPFYSVENITKNDFENVKYISEEDHLKYSRRCIVERDDILMTRIGSIGEPKLVDWDVNASIYVSLALLKIDKERALPNFLYQYMKSTIFKKEILRKSLLQAAPMKINLGDIGKVPIIVPTLKEQQKIAEILSTVDEQIEQTDQLIEKTKELKKGLMQQLLTKGIGHTEFKQTELGEIPVEWEIKKLEEISIFKNGQAHENKVSKDGNFILVNSKFISTEGRIYKKVSENLSPLEIDDITMVMSDLPNGKAFAKCFLVPINDKYTLNQRICAITPKEVNPKFLYYQLNRNKYFMKYDNGVGQTNLKKIEVLECPILIPSTDEQQKIAKILTSVDEDIEGYEEEKEKYEELKKGLMQQLLTGKTRVKVD